MAIDTSGEIVPRNLEGHDGSTMAEARVSFIVSSFLQQVDG